MFRRLSAWHILTAALIGVSPACGSGGREDANSQAKTGLAQAMPPSVAGHGSELTSVRPLDQRNTVQHEAPDQRNTVQQTAPAAPADAPSPEVKPVEPEIAPAPVKAQDEILDRMVFDAERKPTDVRLRVKLARALLEAGKIGEARVHAERAIEVDEKSAAAWHTLGRIQMAERDYEAAAVSFRRAVQEQPESSYAWNNLGYVLIELKNFEEAAAALEKATSGTSPTGYMWNNLGMAYEHLDRIREARAAYRQAAAAGSSKGAANLERLEGVTSLRRAQPVDDGVDIEKVDDDEEDVDPGSAGTSSSRAPQVEELGC